MCFFLDYGTDGDLFEWDFEMIELLLHYLQLIEGEMDDLQERRRTLTVFHVSTFCWTGQQWIKYVKFTNDDMLRSQVALGKADVLV